MKLSPEGTLRRLVAAAIVTTTALIVLALNTGCPSAQAQSPWMSWNTVRLKASGVPLMTGQIEMRFQNDDEGSVLETQSRARFLGAIIARSRTESILDPSSLATLRHSSISKKRGRRYLFDESGYTVERLDAKGDATRPLDEWEVRSTKRFDHQVDDQGAATPLYDYYAMLIYLREIDLDKEGDEATVHLATKDGPRSYTIFVAEVRAGERTFLDLATDQKKTLATRELRLRLVPADPENADEGFLDMEGETELWVEAESKTPLQIAGNVPKAGRVKLTLFAMGNGASSKP